MRFKIIATVLLAVAFTAFCGFDSDGCDSTPPSDKAQQTQQEQMAQNANQQVGMPGITNFTEKKIMRRLYEMRDQNIATFTYLVDLQGQLHHVCDSIGYGLPYSTQFSNPEKITQSYSQSYGTLPQSEPNGLFMPASAEGTWVICASTKGEFTPMYLEPRVIVSPFRLRAVGDYALPDNKNDALTKQELHSNYVPAVK